MKKLLHIKQNIEAERKITGLENKVTQMSEKGYDFLLDRMYFTGNDGYQNFLVYAQVLSSLITDSIEKVINWISTGII